MFSFSQQQMLKVKLNSIWDFLFVFVSGWGSGEAAINSNLKTSNLFYSLSYCLLHKVR